MNPRIPKFLVMKRFWVYLVALSCVVPLSLAQQKLDQLLVYGDNFMFSVKEPPGWNGDTTNAERFQSNVVLHESGQPTDSTSGLIRIRVNEKLDENTRADLEADMRDYNGQYPMIQFKDIPAKNPNYLCLAMVFYVHGKFYEYVAYVNPGHQKPCFFPCR